MTSEVHVLVFDLHTYKKRYKDNNTVSWPLDVILGLKIFFLQNGPKSNYTVIVEIINNSSRLYLYPCLDFKVI